MRLVSNAWRAGVASAGSSRARAGAACGSVTHVSHASSAALRAPSSSFSSSPAVVALPGDLAALERAAASRVTVRHFDASRPVPRALLSRVLAVTRATPSGWNLQPYAVVLVDTPAARERLAAAMLGGNAERVRSAPLSAVFLADAEPLEHGRLERVVAAERAAGAPSAFLRSLPVDAGVAVGHAAALAAAVRAAALGVLGAAVGGLPEATPPAEWAAKNAGLASMSFLLAAAAGGLATCAMEGVRPPAVRAALRVPGHYNVAMVVAVGYAAGARVDAGGEAGAAGGGGAPAGGGSPPPLEPAPPGDAIPERARRLPTGYLFRDNSFDVPWRD